MSTVIRELDQCIFCGNSEMTEEHLIADWAYRAFARSRKPEGMLHGRFITRERMRIDGSDPVVTAKVICKRCNNEWLSRIDNAASLVLKPLVRGGREVTLDRAGQTAVAAWIYKCALILDAAERGLDGPLAVLRRGFMKSRLAGPGCIIYAGPAGRPPSVRIGNPPTTVNLWMLGVRPTDGRLRMTVNIASADGENITPGTPKNIPIPGYQVMVGALWAYLGGQVRPVSEEALQDFARIWPAESRPVTIRAASLDTRKVDAA